jgi:hypothetical protein
VLAHPQRQRLDAAGEQPGLEGREHRAGGELQEAHAFRELGLGEHHDAREQVGVAAEVLRRRVHDDVGAVLDRAEVDRAREGRVDDERDPELVRQEADRPQVHDATGGVDRRLEEDGARLLPEAAAPRARLERVDERHADAEGRELLAEQAVRAAVEHVTRQQVVARPEQGEQGARRRAHAAGE